MHMDEEIALESEKMLMIEDRLQRQLDFLIEIDRLKHVLRRSPLVDGSRVENSAEHSWHLAMMALVLSEHANEPVDLVQVIRLVLVHDIVEIDAGDTYAYDSQANGDKVERELRAAERLFGLLPPDQAAEIRALWDEFEAGRTAEARFANALDRLMPLLHNYLNEGRVWRANQVTIDQIRRRMAPVAVGSATLGTVVETVLLASLKRGYLAGPDSQEG
jgi:putative hydrolases of HD superfamily